MTDDSRIPPDLESLDRSLRRIQFKPREAFGPELMGRLRRGERATGAESRRRFRPALLGIAASILVAAASVLLLRAPHEVTVDRCCYDLDGGGEADDGVTLIAERDSRVHRLRVYEDLDRSGAFSSGDLVRLDRGDNPSMRDGAASGLVTVEHCCLDFDGGGPADDALLVIGVPPDRVMMAAIYERPAGSRRGERKADSFPLR